MGGHFVLPKRSFWPNFFSKVVARLQWDPAAIDLTADARAWPELPAERRRRLMTLLAGFRVAEDAVSEHITPFADAAREATLASQESLMAWVFFLQRRDEDRHARFFDRDRRRGARAARRHPRRAARSGPGPRPGWGARALRGAAARDGRRARGGPHRAGRGRRPLPHGARGDRLRRRASRAARRPGRRRPAGGARGRGARRARRALAHRLRPALPDRGPAVPGAPRRSAGARRGRHRGLGRRPPAATREHIADLCHHRLAAVGLIEPHVAAERAVRRAPAASSRDRRTRPSAPTRVPRPRGRDAARTCRPGPWPPRRP